MEALDRSPGKKKSTLGRPATVIIGLAIATLLLATAGVLAWQMTSVSHAARGYSERSFVIDADFDKFRKIMVRKDATAAIVANSGMELIEEQLQGLSLDTANDEHPILNALRGKSKSDLVATKQLVVSLEDPALEADRLSLTQQAAIEPHQMRVHTKANQPAGNLEDYTATLTAEPEGGKTKVIVTVEQTVRVKVPKMFVSHADGRVQEAADESTRQQQQSITEFVAQYADQTFVLPELGDR